MVFEIIGNYLSISGHFHPKPIYLETHMNYSVSYVWNSCSPRCVMILKILVDNMQLMNCNITIGPATKIIAVVNISINGTIKSYLVLMFILPIRVYRKALDQPIDDKPT